MWWIIEKNVLTWCTQKKKRRKGDKQKKCIFQLLTMTSTYNSLQSTVAVSVSRGWGWIFKWPALFGRPCPRGTSTVGSLFHIQHYSVAILATFDTFDFRPFLPSAFVIAFVCVFGLVILCLLITLIKCHHHHPDYCHRHHLGCLYSNNWDFCTKGDWPNGRRRSTMSHNSHCNSKQRTLQCSIQSNLHFNSHCILLFNMLHTICFLFHNIKKLLHCIAILFKTSHCILATIATFLSRAKCVAFYQTSGYTKCSGFNTGVENIIKQLFWCDYIGPMQCVEYYCVFMQLPMSNHSIDPTNALQCNIGSFSWAGHRHLFKYCTLLRNTKCKTQIDNFFLLEICIFELSTLDLEGHLMLGFMVLYGWWLWCNVKMGLLYLAAHPPIAGLKPFPTKVHTAQV